MKFSQHTCCAEPFISIFAVIFSKKVFTESGLLSAGYSKN